MKTNATVKKIDPRITYFARFLLRYRTRSRITAVNARIRRMYRSGFTGLLASGNAWKLRAGKTGARESAMTWETTSIPAIATIEARSRRMPYSRWTLPNATVPAIFSMYTFTTEPFAVPGM